MRPLHVLHVIDNLSPGGTERQCAALARGLAGLGARNTVCYFRGGALLAELERSGITARAVPQASLRSGRCVSRLLRLALTIRRAAPDVVQTYGFHSNLRGLLAAFLAGAPVRVAGRRDLGEYRGAAQRRVERLVWRLAHRVIANSDAARQQLLREGGLPAGKAVVIRNGLDVGDWPIPGAPGNGSGDAVVGIVAHFRDQKDHPTFLRAAREILKGVPSARFQLVGSGVLEPAIRDLAVRLGIAARTEFFGQLDPDAVRAALARFHVSVLTSKNNEGLPNAVLESMAAGRPVVATAVGGIPEVIDDGVTGYLVPPQDPAAVAERVVALLNDPSLAARMGARGRQKVEREFTLAGMVARFHTLYRDSLAETRAQGN